MEDPAEFGPYRLDGELGSGGMGVVYRALDRRVPRTVALKILHASLAADPMYRERFRRESATLSAVEHPHIIPLYNSGEIANRLFLDMRFIMGDDLQAALDHRGAMPARRAVTMVDSLADALDFVHERGVLHRDIKPKNVMLAGARFFPYLLDFGIARSEAESALTQTGTVAGSLEYMAPERFRGAPADRRSDLYALAGVFVACLTGQAPYPGASGYLALANAHTDGPVPRPSDADPVLAPFDEVIARGMAKDVAQRYATASEFAEAAMTALENVTGAQEGPTGQWSTHSGDTTGAHGAPSTPTGSEISGPTGAPATSQTGSRTAPPDSTQIGQYADLAALAHGTPPPPQGTPVDRQPPAPPPAAAATGAQSWPPVNAPSGPATTSWPPVNAPGGAGAPHPSASNWGAPPAYGAPYAGPRPAAAMSPVAWGVPVGGLVALIAMFLPWFRASATLNGQSSDAKNSLSAAGDGAVGVIGALLVVAASAWVVVLLLNAAKPAAANKPNPARMAGLASVIAGGIDLVFVFIAWFLVPSNYTFNGESYDSVESQLKAEGGSIGQGPQAGYFLAIVAAAVVIIVGVVLLMTAPAGPGHTPRGPAGPRPPYPPQQQGYPPQNQGYPPPNQPYRRY